MFVPEYPIDNDEDDGNSLLTQCDSYSTHILDAHCAGY